MFGYYGKNFVGQSTIETYHAAVLLPYGDTMYNIEVIGKDYTAETAALNALLQLTNGKSSEHEVRSAKDDYRESGSWKQFFIENKKSNELYRVAVVHTNTRDF